MKLRPDDDLESIIKTAKVMFFYIAMITIGNMKCTGLKAVSYPDTQH
ncbi:MAG: hypothetical protein ACK5KP_04440 [Paludibacteraceae bacterium]